VVSATKPASEAVSGIADPLEAVIRWARLRYYQHIADSAKVRIDRSAISLLNLLARLGPLRTSEVAQRQGLDRSTVSRQVASVVDAGWVCRTNDLRDARAALLSLTDEGKLVHEKLRNAHQTVTSELVDDWDSHDQHELARLLGKLAVRMEQSET
jgi:DNA-binding MarR family transcriptional regulator